MAAAAEARAAKRNKAARCRECSAEATNKRPRTEKQGDKRRDKRGPRKPRQRGQGRSDQRSQQDATDLQKLLEATAKLTLKLADASQMVLQDCGVIWFVSVEAGGFLSVMYGVSAECKHIKEATPAKLTRPLFSIMRECLRKELMARVQRANQDENLQQAAVAAQ